MDEAAQAQEEAALERLAGELERQGLRELWVEPDSNCFYEALAQLLFANAGLRARAEAGGVVFEPKDAEVDGVRLRLLPGAAAQCRAAVGAFMRD